MTAGNITTEIGAYCLVEATILKSAMRGRYGLLRISKLFESVDGKSNDHTTSRFRKANIPSERMGKLNRNIYGALQRESIPFLL